MVASVVIKCCQLKESCQACPRTISVLEPDSTPSDGGHILGHLLRNARGKFRLLPCNRALVIEFKPCELETSSSSRDVAGRGPSGENFTSHRVLLYHYVYKCELDTGTNVVNSRWKERGRVLELQSHRHHLRPLPWLMAEAGTEMESPDVLIR